MKPILTLAPDGKIAADGVWDLSMAQYHSDICTGPSVSSSGLRTIWAQSPAHYYLDSPLNPQRPVKDDERPHFSIGRAAHHLLFLGRKGFDQEFAVRPSEWKDWRTAASKEWKAEQIKAGLTIITDGELEAIAGMARSLAEHPMVKSGILDGAVERSLIWQDRETGVWLKSRPDNITTSGGDYSDLKTTTSVSDDALQRTIADFHYQMQGALVGMASEHVLGVTMQSFTLVFVEKAPPHCVRVVSLTDEDLRRGAQQVRASVDIFARCAATGHWPGPGGDQTDACNLSIRDWNAKQIDTRLELLKQTAPEHLQAAE